MLNEVCRKYREVTPAGNLLSIIDQDSSPEFLEALTKASFEKIVSVITSGKLKKIVNQGIAIEEAINKFAKEYGTKHKIVAEFGNYDKKHAGNRM